MGLDLDETFFDDKVQEQYHNMRLLNYPPIDTRLLKAEGQSRAAPHSDYGSITFVFQDAVRDFKMMPVLEIRLLKWSHISGWGLGSPEPPHEGVPFGYSHSRYDRCQRRRPARALEQRHSTKVDHQRSSFHTRVRS